MITSNEEETKKIANKLAKDINISVELIDLRSLRPIDYKTVFESIKKTNRCITVEECFPVCSIGNHLSASIMENVFDYLDSPVINCTGKDVPMPYAKNLELAALITPEEIFEKHQNDEHHDEFELTGINLDDVKNMIKNRYIHYNHKADKKDLNKFSKGCAPCLERAKKIDRQVNGRKLNEIKINEIKAIVRSIFESSKNGT